MKKYLFLTLLLIIICSILIIPIGAATVSSGGTVQPGFIDLKGEPVIGAGNGVGLGAIYTYGQAEVKVKVLLQGFYNSGQQAQTSVLIEARDVPQGQADTPENATILADSVSVTLDQDNNTTGLGKFTKLSGGSYYLVVKHPVGISNTSIHLPVITKTRQNVGNSNSVIDFSDKGSDIVYAPPNKIRACYDGGANYQLRAGDMDGNQIVDVGDFSVWYERFNRFKNGQPDNDPNRPFSQADLEGNNIVDVSDFSIWYGEFSELKLQTGKHGYIP